MTTKQSSHTQVFDVDGMTCGSCAARIETTISAMDGVQRAVVDFPSARVHVETTRSSQAVIEAIDSIGYRLTPRQSEQVTDPVIRHEEQARLHWRRFWIALVLTIPVLALAMFGSDSLTSRLTQAVLSAPVVWWAGAEFHRVAIKGLRTGGMSMDTLVSLGTSVAWIVSAVSLLAGGPLFFETAAVIVTLIILGRAFEARAKGRASGAVSALIRLGAKEATVTIDGTERQIAIEDLVVGDLMVVLPGARIPTDGTIRRGQSSIDEGMISGESVPVDKGVGEPVFGATINTYGHLVVEATKVGSETALARIVAMVERVQASKAPSQRLADKVSARFVPAVVIVAALTFVGWIVASGSLDEAVRASVAVLIIACPCALGLATPTAVMVGSGRGAELGILFKDAEVFERAHNVDVVLFDKTGTLTSGVMAVTDIESDDDQFLQLVASVEAASEHPIGRAVVSAADERGIQRCDVTDFEAKPGFGALGTVGHRKVVVGTIDLISAYDLVVPVRWEERMTELQRDARTVVAAGWDGSVRGVIAFADQLRPGSVETVHALDTAGIDVEMITGDNRQTAEAIAGRAGITRVSAQVRPEDKAELVERRRADGSVVAFVGDGINDAPALVAADLGIAIGSGTDVAIESADIVLVRPDPRGAEVGIRLARRTFATIRGNLFWAFAYNVAAIPLAALGFLDPMIASGAMAFSSVSVVANSLRLRRFRA